MKRLQSIVIWFLTRTIGLTWRLLALLGLRVARRKLDAREAERTANPVLRYARRRREARRTDAA